MASISLPTKPFVLSLRSTFRACLTWAAIGLALGGVAITPAQAQFQGPDTQVDLLAETTSIQPGKPFTVAVRLRMEPEWHIYWQNPGDSGSTTRIEWTLPTGFRAGAIQWPKPHMFVMDSMVSYGYEDEVVLLTQITPPPTLATGKPVTLGAQVKWLICSEQCVPQDKELSLQLDVKGATPTPNSAGAAVIAATRKALPVSATQAGLNVRSDAAPLKAGAKAGPMRINLRFSAPTGTAIQPERLKKAYFYVADTYTLLHPTSQTVLKEGNGYRIPLTTAEDAEPLKRLRGTLVIPTVGGGEADSFSRGVLIDVPVAPQTSPKRPVAGR